MDEIDWLFLRKLDEIHFQFKIINKTIIIELGNQNSMSVVGSITSHCSGNEHPPPPPHPEKREAGPEEVAEIKPMLWLMIMLPQKILNNSY